MNAEDLSFRRSTGAQQILIDCRAISARVGAPLKCASWSRGMAHTDTPCHLTMTFNDTTAIRKAEFTLNQVMEYLTEPTNTEVKNMLSAALESVLSDLEEE